MSKAIQGAAEIGLAVGFFAAAALIPGAGFLVGSIAVDSLIAGIGMMGVGMEAGAIANAISGNRGENITIRQPASPRQIVYGMQRIGGVIVFLSTTGSSKDQFNFVIVLAGHELWTIQDLYLDGRKVYWHGTGGSYQVRNGSGFGGGADGNSHLGPTGNNYTFNDASSGHSGVFAAVRYGDQIQGDYIGELTANDGRWGPTLATSGTDCPSMVGCAYFYLKVEYDPNLFPQQPEVKVTVKGKAVYDPRTGLTVYSENPALIIADYIGDTEFGIGDPSVNVEQLIAAANICDEIVYYNGGGGGSEARYSCNYHFDTSTPPGDVIQTMLATCGGRLSRIGGEWYIFPATYIAPSASFGPDSLVDKPSWSSKRSYRDLCNVVRGVYTAPNYPYSSLTSPGHLSDLYDSNGYYDGSTANTFPFAFQPTSYPAYQQDTLHGYPADQYLNEDGGVVLPRELNLPAVLSVSQAQRLAKIELMRNRQQGSGTLIMGPEGFALQPCDTFLMTFPQRGWADKILEVNSVQFVVDDSGGSPTIRVVVGVNETDPSVYDWSPTEELTVYDVSAAPNTNMYATAPPTAMALTSSAATALLQPDGSVIPRIEVTWDTPADVRVTQIAVQHRLSGATAWTPSTMVPVSSNSAYISPVIAGDNYDVRIASVRSNGAFSVWVEIDGFTAGLVLNSQTRDGVGIGSLVGEAYSSGAAAILCEPFTALIGSRSISILPAGEYTLTNDGTIGGSGSLLAQQTLYYVYYVDMTAAGGAITPIATTNKSDYLGKLGYFLIDSIVTPYAASGGSTGVRYYPSTFSDIGTRTTTSPDSAYDGDSSSYASISGQTNSVSDSYGECVFQGDPAIALPTASTLVIDADVTGSGLTTPPGSGTINITINGVGSTLLDSNGAVGRTTYTATVPAGTPLNTVTVDIQAQPSGTSSLHMNKVTVNVYEIYIQS